MSKHIFYEVRDDSGSIWGGESALECADFFAHNQAPLTVWVSEWEGEGEELWQLGNAIDVTPLVYGVARKVRL